MSVCIHSRSNAVCAAVAGPWVLPVLLCLLAVFLVWVAASFSWGGGARFLFVLDKVVPIDVQQAVT